MAMAAQAPQALRYVFSDIWNGVPSTAGLPVELWPYVSPHRVFASAPPARGIWKNGQVVWREVHAPSRYDNGSFRVVSYPEYEPFQVWEEELPGAPLGWVCIEGGEPGKWANLSSTGAEQPATPAKLSSSGAAEVVLGGDGEERSAREEIAGLRRVIDTLVDRLQALESRVHELPGQ